MREEGKAVSQSQAIIWHKIFEIGAELIRAYDDHLLTTSELLEVVHFQLRELARAYHQLSHLHSEKEGTN
jgi:hypothetical protein